MILALSAFLIGFFVAVCYKTGWGADPITVFYAGLHLKTGISLGLASTVVALSMAVAAYFLDKKQVGLGTLITPLFIQWGIDGGMSWLGGSSNLAVRILMLTGGFIGLSAVVALNINCDLGRSAYDGLVLGLGKKLKRSYHFIRWFSDGLLLALGLWLGGSASFANFLAFIILGRMVDFFCERWTALGF